MLRGRGENPSPSPHPFGENGRTLRVLTLLLVAGAAFAGDEVVDIVPGWKKGDVCDLTMSRTIRVRGKRMVARAERALTLDRVEEVEVRDKIVTTTARGAPGSIERRCRRWHTKTVTAVAGLKSETKNETEPAQGTTTTVDVGRDDAFLVEMLEHAIHRKGVKVGESWEAAKEDVPDGEGGKLTFKLVEVVKYKEQRAARVFVMLKATITAEKGKIDVEASGYVYYSLDAGRIIRSNLRGPVKMQLGGVGTVHGTIAEEATLVIVEAGGNQEAAPGND